MLLISILFMMCMVNDLTFDDLPDIDVLSSVADTLYCDGFDECSNYPFGKFNKLDSLSKRLDWSTKNEVVILNHFNDVTCPEAFYIYRDDENIVVFRKNNEEGFDYPFFARFALFQNPNIVIGNGIHVGMDKNSLFEKLNIKNMALGFSVIKFYDINWGLSYFFFTKDILTCILIDVYDGVGANNFLGRIKNYPVVIKSLIDVEYENVTRDYYEVMNSCSR